MTPRFFAAVLFGPILAIASHAATFGDGPRLSSPTHVGGPARGSRRPGPGGRGPRVAGPGHDEHRARCRRYELRMGQPCIDRHRQIPTPHQCLRRRGSLLARPRGRSVLSFFSPRELRSISSTGSPPAAVDTEPFEVISQSTDRILCRRAIALTNYSGTKLRVEVNREVRLLRAVDALTAHGLTLPGGVSAVAFESVNTIKTHRARSVDERYRPAFDLDSRHVQRLAVGDGRRPVQGPAPTPRSARSSMTRTSAKSPPSVSS